jgi:hypothetical protein
MLGPIIVPPPIIAPPPMVQPIHVTEESSAFVAVCAVLQVVILLGGLALMVAETAWEEWHEEQGHRECYDCEYSLMPFSAGWRDRTGVHIGKCSRAKREARTR